MNSIVKKLVFLSALYVSAWGSFAAGSAVDVTATADKSLITIGDTFSYKLSIARSPEVMVSIPDMEKILDKFTIIDREIRAGYARKKGC